MAAAPAEAGPFTEADPQPAPVDLPVAVGGPPQAAGVDPPPKRDQLPVSWPFVDDSGAGGAPLPMHRSDYVELLTATGSLLRAGPEARLPDKIGRQLESLGIASEHWLPNIREYRRRFFAMVGSVHSIDAHCARTDRDRAKGRVWAAQVFRSAA